jgi:hypothetical protein
MEGHSNKKKQYIKNKCFFTLFAGKLNRGTRDMILHYHQALVRRAKQGDWKGWQLSKLTASMTYSIGFWVMNSWQSD